MVYLSVEEDMDEYSGHWDKHGEEVGMGPAFELIHDILWIIH